MGDNILWKDLSVKYHLGSSADTVQVTTTRSSFYGIHVAPAAGDASIALFNWDGQGSAPTGATNANLKLCFNTGDSGANQPMGGIWVPMPGDTSILFEDGMYINLRGHSTDYAVATSITVFYTF